MTGAQVKRLVHTFGMHRRDFLSATIAAPVAATSLSTMRGAPVPQSGQSPARPSRLKPDDTVGLVAPANATFNTVDLDIAR
jgi:hypothetical protein